MNRFSLFVIDPQNDFMDIDEAALPVPGAATDMDRLAQFIEEATPMIDDVVVTLDSHASVGIERTTFWRLNSGQQVAPFTEIAAADVERGIYLPHPKCSTDEVIDYLKALELDGERKLMVWPVHCVLGTWGHNIQDHLARSIAGWEYASGRICDKVIKGLNPMTEQYSAFRAEVPRTSDPRTHVNKPLLHHLENAPGWLLVAGEALSHCVAASGHDMFRQLSADRLSRTIFLSDCMSSVSGFESTGQRFLEEAAAVGSLVLPSSEVAARFSVGIMRT